jgi:energy-coupling factor transporter ATP-binding protein EcfA2
MQIKQISVTGLFGIFDHVIPLNMDERITIVHGPNGFGKTAMLRLLNGLFNSRYSVFRSIPFKIFKVELDDDSSVEIVKNSDSSGKENNKITFKFHNSNSENTPFVLKKTEALSEPNSLIHMIEGMVPGLERIGSRSWQYFPTNEVLSLEEIIDRFEDLLPSKFKRMQKEPDWLTNLTSEIHIRLIESQRLLNITSGRSSKTSPMLPTVSAYSDELAQRMRDKFTEYGVTAQSLDRTFPTRLVKQQSSPDLTDQQLQNQLYELEETRSRLIEVGLLDKNENSDFQIQPETIDESTKNILSVYVEDVEKKLSVFNEIASKIDLLRRIINNKFAYSYKEMNFDKEKGFVFQTLYNHSSPSVETLSPIDLSSGEQHELVLLYELLFKVKPNSLVLIDEPELSLHVGWQVQFLKDLKEIIQLTDLGILMATHSPDIIQDRWDLTVELKGPGK